ncbi:hypothetical protein OKW96_16230 [Sphingobacterium sp. KU25419]|nr:hypothetical protein OKW96_16230 [Sphingobacterium sp. KU25419]
MQKLYTLLREHTNAAQYEKVLDSLRTNILTAFYTPSFIPQTLYKALEETGIQPKSLYEPSAGAGVFIDAGIKVFPALEMVRAVEKDLLTGRILGAVSRSYSVPVETLIAGLEYSSNTDNGTADLVVSNIPFGNFKVFDPLYIDKEKVLTDRIHNYFFAKGLDKLDDGGLMAYITTDTFLNSPGNRVAREYLFGQADFISLAVLPENLMSDTGGTDAPSHLLLVQKHSGKTVLSVEEQQLLETVVQQMNMVAIR